MCGDAVELVSEACNSSHKVLEAVRDPHPARKSASFVLTSSPKKLGSCMLSANAVDFVKFTADDPSLHDTRRSVKIFGK